MREGEGGTRQAARVTMTCSSDLHNGAPPPPPIYTTHLSRLLLSFFHAPLSASTHGSRLLSHAINPLIPRDYASYILPKRLARLCLCACLYPGQRLGSGFPRLFAPSSIFPSPVYIRSEREDSSLPHRPTISLGIAVVAVIGRLLCIPFFLPSPSSPSCISPSLSP